MNNQLININLSEEFERRKRRAAPRKQMPAALGLVVVATLGAMAVFYMVVFLKSQKLQHTRRQQEQIKGPYEESIKLQALSAKLSTRMRGIDAWNAARVSVADRWLQTAKLVPEYLYLTQIEFSPVDPQANTQHLVLKGRAFGVEGETLILHFLRQLREDPLFSNVFTTATLAPVRTEGAEKVFSIELSRGKASGGTP